MNDYEKNIEIMKDLKNKLDQVINKEEGKTVSDNISYAHPDPVKHKYISFAKSGIRIIGALVLISGNLVMAGVCLALAEVLGIVEELV
jgi:hypothetical protein